MVAEATIPVTGFVAHRAIAIISSQHVGKQRNKLIDLSQDIFPREQQTPQALAAYHKAEIEKWWPIIKAAEIKPE